MMRAHVSEIPVTATPEGEALVDQVKERYGRIATGAQKGCCGTGDAEQDVALQIGYGKDTLAKVPEGANLGLGCGAPIDHLRLRAGETVLDLGSGGGLDAFLAADAGRAHGPGDRRRHDARDARARAGQRRRRPGFDERQFREGRLEALPVDDASVDAVTSNCVINLVPDKARSSARWPAC